MTHWMVSASGTDGTLPVIVMIVVLAVGSSRDSFSLRYSSSFLWENSALTIHTVFRCLLNNGRNKYNLEEKPGEQIESL